MSTKYGLPFHPHTTKAGTLTSLTLHHTQKTHQAGYFKFRQLDVNHVNEPQYTTARGGQPLYPISTNTHAIICNNNSSPANISAPIAAGETLRVKWWNPGPWPSNHKGPVIDYIAPCNGSCSTVDPRALKFVKFAERGWIDDSREEGYWATDMLLDDDSSWNITIPEGLRAGEYVLRTEIIVRHANFFTLFNPQIGARLTLN